MSLDEALQASLYDVFTDFCNFGKGHVLPAHPTLTSFRCQKLCRDCGLLGKDLSRTDVDLIFCKIRGRGEHGITFPEFVACTRQWAQRKGVPHEELVRGIVTAGGPTLNHVTEPDHDLFTEPVVDYEAGSRSAVQARKPTVSAKDRRAQSMTPPRRTRDQLHPDWYEVANPNPHGPGEEVYYVNRYTNATTWDKPLKMLSLTETPHPREFKSVYDKLTDVSLYTGTHRHRFDPETGRGLGREGRDTPAKEFGAPGMPLYGSPSKYRGNTNTGTDEVFHDLSQVISRR